MQFPLTQQPILIEKDKDLAKYYEILCQEHILAVDTEFERYNTYFAKLSLIQIASRAHTFIVDTLKIKDLDPIKQLLANNSIIKIFHSGKQDIEIFWHKFNILPSNVFDTQVAAKFCSFGASISYDKLCLKIFDITIDKTYQLSDWMKRPISLQQLCYAAGDVYYLYKMYEHLSFELNKLDKINDYNLELKKFLVKSNFIIDYTCAWKKLKGTRNYSYRPLRLQHICAWREEFAVKLNIPRKHLLDDQEIYEVCKKLPQTHRQLELINFSSRYLMQNKIKYSLLEVCKNLSSLEKIVDLK